MRLTILLTAVVAMLGACAQKPLYLGDGDIIPAGSKLEFWVDHDEHGWHKSNVYVAMLPRAMTGLEARHWAEGAGDRDAGIRWTRYYVVATPESLAYPPRRTAVYTRKNASAWIP
jgi:hypothetical protein